MSRQDPSVLDQLLERPASFEFFRAVELLRAAVADEARAAGSDPLAPGMRADDRIRFGSAASLGFQSTQIVSLHATEPKPFGDEPPDPFQRRYRLVIDFLGLIGTSGALPWHYTVDAIESLRDREPGFADFLDVFHTRLLHLFYQAWEKYQLAPRYAASHRPGDEAARDPFTECLLSLMGLGTAGQTDRVDVEHEAHLRYAAFFADHRRNPTSLAAMLGDFFGVPVMIEQFRTQWLDIPEADRTLFPVPGQLRSFNNQLSVNAVLGSRVQDCQGRFRVRIGPLGFENYLRFIREGVDLERASHLTRLYVRSEFDFDIQPVLKAGEVPRWKLTSPPTRTPHRLGRTTWLKSVDTRHDFDEMAYESTDAGQSYTRTPTHELPE